MIVGKTTRQSYPFAFSCPDSVGPFSQFRGEQRTSIVSQEDSVTHDILACPDLTEAKAWVRGFKARHGRSPSIEEFYEYQRIRDLLREKLKK